MNRIRGYIFSRPFMGERVPQHVQNLVIRDYCARRQLQFLLSATEYAMPGCDLILAQVLDELPEVDGIVVYSLFQLPEGRQGRSTVFALVLPSRPGRSGSLNGHSGARRTAKRNRGRGRRKRTGTRAI